MVVKINKYSFIGALFGALLMSPSIFAATFTVNTTADTDLLTTCIAPSPCSLREAIREANNTPGPDNIVFDIPGAFADPGHGKYSITPTLPLPFIFESVTIDATTQPGFNQEPVVELNGDRNFISIALINHNDSSVKGLIINNSSAAILIFGGGDHHISGNWFGPDATGLLPVRNLVSIVIQNSENNLIGGETESDRNIISGNSDGGDGRYQGIFLINASHNRIEGNWLGLDKTGLTALANNGEGIYFAGSSNFNVIGGSPSKRNVISATRRQQAIQHDTGSDNIISFNCFGTNKDCAIDPNPISSSPFANGYTVIIDNEGTEDETERTVLHETITMVHLDPNLSGDNNIIEYNLIAQNGLIGVFVEAGNFGVPLETGEASSVVLRGTQIRNNQIINTQELGIFLSARDLFSPVLDDQLNPPAKLEDTVVTGNTIVNAGLGILLRSSDNNVALFPNHVNQPSAIENTTITGNTIVGMQEGINLTSHVYDTHIEDNTIGQVLASAAIWLSHDVLNTKIINNRIGLAPNGAPLPNFVGVLITPVYLFDPFSQFTVHLPPMLPSSNVLIEGNTIANTVLFPLVVGSDIDQFVPTGILDESIEPDAIDASSKNVAILNNAIFNNASIGIDLSTFATTIPGGIINVNDGVTENDPDNQNDADNGANDLQNFPKINKAKFEEDGLVIHAKLQSEPGMTYAIHFYLNDLDTRDGRIPVGEPAIIVTKDNGKGHVKVVRPIPVGAVEGMYMTATATKICEVDEVTCPYGYGGTSEFSEPRKVESKTEEDDSISYDF